MQLHVFQDQKQLGPFALDNLHEMLRLGSLNDTAFVWHEGLPDWQPIGPFLAANPAAVPVAVPVPLAPPIRAHVPRSSEPSDVGRLARAILAGGVACLIAAGLWAAIAIGLHVQLGILAWGVGVMCGFAVARFGRGNGVVFQVIAVGYSLLGIALGKLACVIGLGFLPLGLFDLLWIVFAVASAWKTAGGGSD